MMTWIRSTAAGSSPRAATLGRNPMGCGRGYLISLLTVARRPAELPAACAVAEP